VNQPKPDKKNGTVVDSNKKIWRCPPDLLGRFKPGVKITIEHYSNEFKGQQYFFIHDIVPDQNPNAAPATASAPAAAPTAVLADLIVAIAELTKAIQALTEYIGNLKPPF
jgi:hypothetical protein